MVGLNDAKDVALEEKIPEVGLKEIDEAGVEEIPEAALENTEAEVALEVNNELAEGTSHGFRCCGRPGCYGRCGGFYKPFCPPVCKPICKPYIGGGCYKPYFGGCGLRSFGGRYSSWC